LRMASSMILLATRSSHSTASPLLLNPLALVTVLISCWGLLAATLLSLGDAPLAVGRDSLFDSAACMGFFSSFAVVWGVAGAAASALAGAASAGFDSGFTSGAAFVSDFGVSGFGAAGNSCSLMGAAGVSTAREGCLGASAATGAAAGASGAAGLAAC